MWFLKLMGHLSVSVMIVPGGGPLPRTVWSSAQPRVARKQSRPSSLHNPLGAAADLSDFQQTKCIQISKSEIK